MHKDAIWKAFTMTGDPLYYLLFKSAEVSFGSRKEEREESASL